MRSRDTTPEAYEVQIGLFRRMTLEGRVARAVAMSRQARTIAIAGIRHRHPHYDDETARYVLFRILVEDELFMKAWPRAPLVDP